MTFCEQSKIKRLPSQFVIGADDKTTDDKMKQLETEIQTLKAKLESKTNSELNSGQQNNVDIYNPSFTSQDIEVDLPTATDALASEAAFMENIGLYLNPRQSLTKGRVCDVRSCA